MQKILRFWLWVPHRCEQNEPVGNLGAVCGPTMNMSACVSTVIKYAFYHLRNIGKMRAFLNTDTTKSAIVSLASSHLD